MTEKKLVLCVGADRSHWRIRKLVIEMAGAKAILAEGYEDAYRRAASQDFDAAIIGNDLSPEDTALIRSRIITSQKNIPILDLPPVVNRQTLSSFVARLLH